MENESNLSVDNPNWMYALSILDQISQTQYTRSIHRYLDFCNIEALAKENAESVEKFLIFCKNPESKAGVIDYSNNQILLKEAMAAKTLWSVLSHLKKFFNACNNRHICNENARLNGILLQWEKLEEINQAKV